MAKLGREAKRKEKHIQKRLKQIEKKRHQVLTQQGSGLGPVGAHEQKFDEAERAILKASDAPQ